ncbi:glycosyl transferase, partial [Pediococcus acidilactici]
VVLTNHSSTDKSKFGEQVVTGQIRTDLTKKAKKTQHITYKTNADWLPTGFYLSPSKALKGTELHLEISNLHFKPYTLKQQQHVALNQYRYKHVQDARNAQKLIDRQYNSQAFTWNWYKT